MRRTILAACCLGLTVSVATAQLTPERLYNGVNRPLVVQVEAPEDASRLEIALYERPGGASAGRSPAVPGRVDLAGLFPSLWKGPRRVLYAQLEEGGEGLGPPLVLEPMWNPDRARLTDPATGRPTNDPRRGRVVFDSERAANAAESGASGSVWSPVPEGFTDTPVFSGMRVYPARFIEWETDAGSVVFRLRPDAAPNTAFWHLHLVEGGFYRDIEIHRVVNLLDSGARFVVQVGDPTGTGNGGPGFDFDLERSTLAHDFGVLSMARAGDPDTNGSQVFVALSRSGTGRLDGRYAAFGELVEGASVLNAIASMPVDENDRPIEPVLLRAVRSVPAPSIDRWPGPATDPEVEAASGR
ncbi:MAG: peptidylprolyl isomerase [Phycisphaerales bacterium JB040]